MFRSTHYSSYGSITGNGAYYVPPATKPKKVALRKTATFTSSARPRIQKKHAYRSIKRTHTTINITTLVATLRIGLVFLFACGLLISYGILMSNIYFLSEYVSDTQSRITAESDQLDSLSLKDIELTTPNVVVNRATKIGLLNDNRVLAAILSNQTVLTGKNPSDIVVLATVKKGTQ